MISKRSVGFLLALISVVAVATIFQDYRFDGLIDREHAAGRAIDSDLAQIATSVSELRAVQASYVATGQAPAAWMTRGTELFDRLQQALDLRRQAAPTSAAVSKYDAALTALGALQAIDARARVSVRQDDRLHAADLIFIDALTSTDTLNAEIAAARSIEDQTVGERARRFAMMRLAMNGLAIILVSLMALYFGRALSIVGTEAPATMAQMIRNLPPPVKTGGAPVAGASPAAAASAAGTSAAPTASLPRPVSLGAAAELCVDLARLLDGRDIPALLERLASVIDAKGIMIWSIDTSGAMLRPSLCQGYSEKVKAKLRPLLIDGDNVTALAFRTMQTQVLPGNLPTDPGAIAVPLITATGCVGVLAAELRQSRPHPDLVPIARIVAAQFSTLVAPADDASKQTALM